MDLFHRPAEVGRLRVILLWHHHQPFYRDLRSGEYRLPWVRLHGLNEYYTMGLLAREFPELPLAFNLVPSLLRQLEEYARGEARDPWLDLSRRAPGDLTEGEIAFLLGWFFIANPQMVASHPRYQALARLSEEVGELARELNHRFGQKTKKPGAVNAAQLADRARTSRPASRCKGKLKEAANGLTKR